IPGPGGSPWVRPDHLHEQQLSGVLGRQQAWHVPAAPVAQAGGLAQVAVSLRGRLDDDPLPAVEGAVGDDGGPTRVVITDERDAPGGGRLFDAADRRGEPVTNRGTIVCGEAGDRAVGHGACIVDGTGQGSLLRRECWASTVSSSS